VHDVLDLRDVVADELEQRLSSGYTVEHLRTPIGAAVAGGEEAALSALASELVAAPRQADWPFADDEVGAVAGRPAPGRPPGWDLQDRLLGAWLGRCAGCCLGKPVEGLSRTAIRAYLTAAGAWPLRDFVALVAGWEERLHPCAAWAARGRFDAMPRDDDTDWTLLNLSVLETVGREFTTEDLAGAWLRGLPFLQVYTAERAAYRNLVRGLQPPATAQEDNPYREWIGALIRADAWAYVSPGDPAGAVDLALRDARLSHTGNGIAGEAWAAALIAAALTAPSARAALEVARTWVPVRSRFGAAQDLVLELRGAGCSWEAALDVIGARLGHYSWVHAVSNGAVIAAGLLWGEGDFAATVGLTVQGGWDTDSNGATAGSVAGALLGAAAVPERFVAPFGDRIRSAVWGFDGARLSEVARRFAALASG
jgi:ADP-ribosylglycohydrolase